MTRICMTCIWHARTSIDDEYDLPADVCMRVSAQVIDPVTGSKTYNNRRMCSTERSKSILFFWQDRCGPSGKHYTRRSLWEK